MLIIADTIALKLSKARVATVTEIPDLVQDTSEICDAFSVNTWPSTVLTSMPPQKIISNVADLVGLDSEYATGGAYPGTVEWSEVSEFRRRIESICEGLCLKCMRTATVLQRIDDKVCEDPDHKI